MVMAEKENVVSVLEDHLLESISSTGWNQSEEEADFTYVTEKYNHFQRNLAEADMRNTGCLFAIVVGDSLMISVIGSMNTTLREKNGDLSMIAENDENSLEFSSVSHGKIPH